MKTKKALSALIAIAAAGALMVPCCLQTKPQEVRATSGAQIQIDKSDPVASLARLPEFEGIDVQADIRLERVLDVAYGKVYRFQQVYGDADVFGGDIAVSVDHAGMVLSVNGNYRDVGTMSEAMLDETTAIAEAEALGGNVLFAEKTVYAVDSAAEPAYEIYTDQEGGTRLFISATDGEILLHEKLSFGLTARNTSQTDAFGNTVNVDIEYSDNTYYLADYTRNIFTLDANTNQYYASKTAVFSDPMAVSIYSNVVRAYDFYTEENVGATLRGINNGNDNVWGNWERRNSEIPLFLYVHYNTNGYRENAAFSYDPENNQALILVGDGNETGSLYEQGKSLDIIAHEYQHGVTNFAAGLVHLGDSGAINEAISDVFGALVEGHEPYEEEFWNMGENSTPNDISLRSTKNPTGEYKANAKDKYVCTRSGSHYYHNCDNNGVHANSTIISNLVYDMWMELPEFFTREVIGKLWYATLCNLAANSTFEDFAVVIENTATALGFDEDARAAVHTALLFNGILSDPNLHVVEFLNYNGEVLKTSLVVHGEAAIAPETPTRKSSAQYEYVFKGWNKSFDSITTDLKIVATYESVLRSYTVRFVDADNNLLKQETVLFGSMATPPTPPEKLADKQFEYEFVGWNGNLNFVTGDTTYTPRYSRTLRSYTVTFLDAFGNPLMEEIVPYGSAAMKPLDAPLRESTPQLDFRFMGWEEDFDFITGDLTVSPVYEEVLRSYIVTMYVDGTPYALTAHYGDTIDFPVPAEREGDVFAGWYLDEARTIPASGVVEGDVILYARWKSDNGLSTSAKAGIIAACFAVLIAAAVLCTVMCVKRKKR